MIVLAEGNEKYRIESDEMTLDELIIEVDKLKEVLADKTE